MLIDEGAVTIRDSFLGVTFHTAVLRKYKLQ